MDDEFLGVLMDLLLNLLNIAIVLVLWRSEPVSEDLFEDLEPVSNAPSVPLFDFLPKVGLELLDGLGDGTLKFVAHVLPGDLEKLLDLLGSPRVESLLQLVLQLIGNSVQVVLPLTPQDELFCSSREVADNCLVDLLSSCSELVVHVFLVKPQLHFVSELLVELIEGA